MFDKELINKKLAEFDSLIVEDDVRAAVHMYLVMTTSIYKKKEVIKQVQEMYNLSLEQATLLVESLQEKDNRIKFKDFGIGLYQQLLFGNNNMQIYDPTKIFSLKMVTEAVSELYKK